MDMLKKIILSACILSIVISVADTLKPSEKYARQLRMIFSMIFISGIIASGIRSDFKLEIPAFADTEYGEQYDDISAAAEGAVEHTAESSLADMICRILTSQGISFEKITADININEDGSININEIGYCGSEFEKASEIIKENLGETEVKQIE